MLKTRSELGLGPVMNREWAMPSPDTFSVRPIANLARRYLRESELSADIFARNSGLASITNDLNPQTTAEYHMLALDFLKMLQSKAVHPDLVIFDPPYSLRQIKECYESVGVGFTQSDTQGWFTREKIIITDILKDNGIVITCGWNSTGMGNSQVFKLEEILLVAHGEGPQRHNRYSRAQITDAPDWIILNRRDFYADHN